jgi:uncharacterized membrane protein YoaK (UPF0700 family)
VKPAVALALTFTAGIVDIVGYIAVYHLFVAHMTGSTVHLGNKLAIGDWTEAAKAGSILVSFVLGSIAGRSIIEAGSRPHKRTVASITLLAEAFLIFVFILVDRLIIGSQHASISSRMICLLLSLLAAAMGLQTATLTRIGPLTIHTTFVTGMLNKFAQTISQWAFWVHDQRRGQATLGEILRRSTELSEFRNARFMFAIWFTYMIGSVVGTLMNSRWDTRVLFLPVAILLASVVVDQIQPLSVEEEKEQA